MTKLQETLLHKYRHYDSLGHLLLTVTLSTYIQSASYAASDRLRHMWDHHFIRRVKRRLPKASLDYDWTVECSPDGYFHYHGLLAVPSQYSYRLWKQDHLNEHLHRDLTSFQNAGEYRPFRINRFLIEPAANLDAWIAYITKDSTRNGEYNKHH